MANSYNQAGRLFILDTAHASNLIKATHAAFANLSEILRVSVRWVGPTAAGHEAIVHTPAGAVLWHAKAIAANNGGEDSIIYRWDGDFLVPTLASGVLYIYHHGEVR